MIGYQGRAPAGYYNSPFVYIRNIPASKCTRLPAIKKLRLVFYVTLHSDKFVAFGFVLTEVRATFSVTFPQGSVTRNGERLWPARR